MDDLKTKNNQIITKENIEKFFNLTPYNIEKLTDDWCFMSLINFADDVERECLLDYDGYGEFIYIDKDGIMYTKEDEWIHPSDIHKVISEAANGKILFTCIDAAEAIREKYTDGEYKPFAVFWYNK